MNAIKKYSFKLNKNVILKTFDSNIQVPFRETYIWFDYKQQETFSETKQFFENIVIESNSSFLKYFKNSNKKEKIEFLFEFLRTKSKENIPVLENKKFGKGCLKLSEHILYLKCFLSFKYVVGGIIKHSPSNFCPCFLINQVGMSGFHRLHVV